MINVIYLVSRLKQSGPINQAFNIVTGMDKSKCKMIVVTLSPELAQSRMQMYKDAGIEVVQLNRKEWDIYGCVRDLIKLIKDGHIDIVHSSGDRPDLCNHFLRSKVATITTLRSEVKNLAERRGFLVRWITQKVHSHNIRTVHLPIACSQFLANSIEKSTGRRVQVIHNSVNTCYFKPAGNKEDVRKSLGLPPQGKVYLSLGSIIKRKNNDILLDYFTSHQKEDELFVVAGDGEMLDYYKAKYTSQNIKFVGRVDSLPYLQAADFLVSAALSEGLPNTVLEAIACGLPVILSDIGPHREILNEGDMGALFDSSNLDSFASAMGKMQKTDYNFLTRNCYQIANEKFSIKTAAEKYFDLYSSIIEH